mmetsp:Transcript_70363/g.199673  ORF Transcript_70363/g.199673 Transcript_70363/m.199673 type:complete len:368 (+) Transcript_70363:2286-3389(+)
MGHCEKELRELQARRPPARHGLLLRHPRSEQHWLRALHWEARARAHHRHPAGGVHSTTATQAPESGGGRQWDDDEACRHLGGQRGLRRQARLHLQCRDADTHGEHPRPRDPGWLRASRRGSPGVHRRRCGAAAHQAQGPEQHEQRVRRHGRVPRQALPGPRQGLQRLRRVGLVRALGRRTDALPHPGCTASYALPGPHEHRAQPGVGGPRSARRAGDEVRGPHSPGHAPAGLGRGSAGGPRGGLRGAGTARAGGAGPVGGGGGPGRGERAARRAGAAGADARREEEVHGGGEVPLDCRGPGARGQLLRGGARGEPRGARGRGPARGAGDGAHGAGPRGTAAGARWGGRRQVRHLQLEGARLHGGRQH